MIHVVPMRLVHALIDAGFTVANQREGQYIRMRWPAYAGRDAASLLIPLDLSAPEFNDMLGAAQRELLQVVRLAGAIQGGLYEHGLHPILEEDPW